MELDKVIKERRSIRKYSSRKPNWRDIIEAIDLALKVPYAGNIHSIRFILVDKKELIEKIAEACQQDFVREAQYLVVVCSDPTDVIRFYKELGEIYVRQQAGAAIQTFLLKLTDLGLSGCWVGYFVEEQIKEILRIPESVYVEAVIPIGYAGERPLKKREAGVDNFLYFNLYRNKFMKPKKQVEAR
ncbi:MAG: nitroreductase family protein [Candidatus Pacearchaeota archaeon]